VPFVLVSWAQRLRLAAAEGDTLGEHVPWDVAQTVLGRLAALPAGGGDILAAGAVAGRAAYLCLLVALTGLPDAAVAGVLEAARRARLVDAAGPGRYAFAHDVIREVVEADLGAPRRLVLHRAVAAALEHLHAPRLAEHYEALAHHCLRGEV